MLRDLLRAHAPEFADAEIRELGHGLDNTAFLAGDLVVRVARGATVAREARLLGLLAGRLPVPVPVVRFADEQAGVLAYRLLPGRPLLGRPLPAGANPADPANGGPGPAGLATTLGRFLRALHAIEAPWMPREEADPREWLEDLDGPPELLRVLHATVPDPAAESVLAHADLGAEHILEQDGVITGVIDWTDAAITDPALDFARLLRDFGPGFLTTVVDAYGPAPAHDRILYFARCAALEDLAYGGEHARAAERSLTWLF